MTCAIPQLVYLPNFRAIGQSVWEKNGNRQKHRKTETQTDRLEFYKDRYIINFLYFYCFYTNILLLTLYQYTFKSAIRIAWVYCNQNVITVD